MKTRINVNPYTKADGTEVRGYEKEVSSSPEPAQRVTVKLSDDAMFTGESYDSMLSSGVPEEVLRYLQEHKIYMSPELVVERYQQIASMYDAIHHGSPAKDIFIKAISSSTDPEIPAVALLAVHADIGTASMHAFSLPTVEERNDTLNSIAEYATSKGYQNVVSILQARKSIFDGEEKDIDEIIKGWYNTNYPLEKTFFIEKLQNNRMFLEWAAVNADDPQTRLEASSFLG